MTSLQAADHSSKTDAGAKRYSRRQFVGWIAAAIPMASQIALAYPTRPISLVVPVAAGGGVDTMARILAESLQEQMKQPVVVENRPGAGSMIGANFVAKAAPDGYTLLLMEPAALLAKWLTKTVPYDVTSDFTPVALVATQALALFAHPSLPANDLNQLIAYARGNPGKLSIGTAGVGSPHHLAAAWLNTAAGIDITHVPYRGAAPALNDLLAGQIPLIWALPPPVMPFVEQGKVKALAVSTQKRFQNLPDVPTVAESGLQGFDINFFYGVAGPAKMPADAADQIAKAVGIIVARPDFRARMSTLGTSIDFRAGDAFRALIDQENSKYGVIIRDAGIKPD